MSSFSQQLNQSVRVAHFALGKYSQAMTSMDHNGPVNWNHLHGNGDLSVVFEKRPLTESDMPSFQGKLYLKVVHGQQTLEDLDLNYLALEAAQHGLSRQARNLKPAVAILVKLPCLAIRYPSGVGAVRRFQLKFLSDRDYYNVLAILSGINCPFAEPASHTSRSTSLRPASSSSSQMMMSISSPFAPPSDWSYRSPGASGLNLPGNGLSRSQSTLGTSCETRPSISASSASSISSQTACNINESIVPPMSNSGEDILGSGRRPVTQHLGSKRSELELGGHGTLQCQDRPTTAPAFHDPQALNQALPPKRDLPFSRPGPSKTYTSSKSSSGPATKPVGTNGTGFWLQEDLLEPFAPTSSSPQLRAGYEKPSSQRDYAAGSPGQQSTLKEPEKGWAVNQNQNPSQLPATSRSTCSLGDRLIGSATVAAHSPNSPSRSPQAQINASHVSSSLSHLSTSSAHPHYQPDSCQQTTTIVASNNGNTAAPIPPCPSQAQAPAPINSADLSSYLKRPESERATLVDSWICEQLEDDGFLTLCQDVERVWRRIAFGS